jgi:hypothetical protein
MDDQATGTTPPSTPTGAPGGPGDAEWTGRVVDTIEDVVAAVHDRIVRPLMIVARGLVFGIIVGTMALVVAVVLAIGLVRLLDVYAFGGRVWASDTLIGGLLVVAGAYAWSKRHARGAEEG